MESKFLTELVVEEIDDDTWKLFAPLTYQSESLNRIVDVPMGFVTDFASVPRLPLAYWLTGNTAHEAAVVHDYLYQTHTSSKAQADLVFLEAMKVIGTPLWRRYPMYVAVSFAFLSWNSGPSRYKVLNT